MSGKPKSKPPDDETPMQRLERLTKHLLQVPKEAVKQPKKDNSQSS